MWNSLVAGDCETFTRHANEHRLRFVMTVASRTPQVSAGQCGLVPMSFQGSSWRVYSVVGSHWSPGVAIEYCHHHETATTGTRTVHKSPPAATGQGWMDLRSGPQKLTPPVTRAWARTPIEATVDKISWSTSIWRTKAGLGFLPVPKRIRGTKEAGARVTVAFEFVDD